KYMAQMAATVVAHNLGSYHTEGIILLFAYHIAVYRGKKAGPATARVKFTQRFEQRRATAPAGVGSRLCSVPVLPGKWAFCPFFPANPVLFIRQALAPIGIVF